MLLETCSKILKHSAAKRDRSVNTMSKGVSEGTVDIGSSDSLNLTSATMSDSILGVVAGPVVLQFGGY